MSNPSETTITLRLRELVKRVKAVRAAQKAYFSLPKTMSDQTRREFLEASKRAEKELDAYVQLIEYEKLI
jgi:hypothetical protein